MYRFTFSRFFHENETKNRGVKKLWWFILDINIKARLKWQKSDDFAAQTWVSRIWWAANWWCALCTFCGEGATGSDRKTLRERRVFRVLCRSNGGSEKEVPCNVGSGNFHFDLRRFLSVDSCFGISHTFGWLVGSWKLHEMGGGKCGWKLDGSKRLQEEKTQCWIHGSSIEMGIRKWWDKASQYFLLVLYQLLTTVGCRRRDGGQDEICWAGCAPLERVEI